MMFALLLFILGVSAQTESPRGCLSASGNVDCVVTCSGKDACKNEIGFSRLNTGRLLVICENGGPACTSLRIRQQVGSGHHYLHCNGPHLGDPVCNSIELDRTVSYCCPRNACNSRTGGTRDDDACIHELPSEVMCDSVTVPHSDFGHGLGSGAVEDTVLVTCDAGFETPTGSPTFTATCNRLGDWIVEHCQSTSGGTDTSVPEPTTDAPPLPVNDCEQQNTWSEGELDITSMADAMQGRPILFILDPMCPEDSTSGLRDVAIWDFIMSDFELDGMSVDISIGKNIKTDLRSLHGDITANFRFSTSIYPTVVGYVTLTIRDLTLSIESTIPPSSVPVDQAELIHTCHIPTSSLINIKLTGENLSSRLALTVLGPLITGPIEDSAKLALSLCSRLPTPIEEFLGMFSSSSEEPALKLMSSAVEDIFLENQEQIYKSIQQVAQAN